MRLSEITINEGFIDPQEETYLVANETGNSRKPTLTLRQLNKLKKIRATNKLEKAKKDSLLGVMYGITSDDDDGF